MSSSKKLASLSLDADNLWAYQMTHGDPGWDTYPTYLDALAGVVLPMLDELGLRITFFVVGQDAALEKNHEAIASLALAGHEIGNHTQNHPYLTSLSSRQIRAEFTQSQNAIAAAKQKDFSLVRTLLTLLESPFDEHPGMDAYADFPPAWAAGIAISCSS